MKARRSGAVDPELWKLALDSIRDAIWDWRLDTDEVYFSPRWYTMLDYSPGELPPSYETWSALLHPEDRERAEDAVRQHIASGVPFEIEFRMRTKAGDWRWILDRGRVVEQDPQGNALRMLGTHSDISKRKQAEAALREREELFRRTFHTSPDAVNINRLCDGLYVDLNEGFTRLTGYTREDVLGRSSADIGIWCDPEDRRRLVDGLHDTGFVENLEARFRRKNGSVTTALMSARLVQLNGEDHIVSITRDISELRAAEEEQRRLEVQLQQSRKMDALGTLSSGIAHDFNNALAVILGYSELARDELPEGHFARGYNDEIIRAAERARTLVRQILTFSRKVAPDRRQVRLDEVVRDAANLLERTIPKMIRLRIELEEDLPPVDADPQQMLQILLNLVSNAADAIEAGGTIHIATRALHLDEGHCDICGKPVRGEFVELSVTDSGCGMDAETRARAFEPFFTTKEIGAGTGLGLSTVYGIVVGHHGHLSCDSRLGAGSVFRVLLPRTTADAESPAQARRNQGHFTRAQGTILVVDDEEAVRDVASRTLTRSGYRVLTAATGEEALETYRRLRSEIDGVIMDLGMPGMGGRKCLAKIHRLDPEARVLVASGYVARELDAELEAGGACGVVPKPYRRAELLEAVRRMLGN